VQAHFVEQPKTAHLLRRLVQLALPALPDSRLVEPPVMFPNRFPRKPFARVQRLRVATYASCVEPVRFRQTVRNSCMFCGGMGISASIARGKAAIKF
jgi:hypothetical protein